ncbi:MAG TPA: hypothetical protein PKK00_11860, partial [Bacteroidales bacterium]|nr:hypothetical protein [Bacteroidales bacterium]HPS15730.1 hypothetical protein [Bacteroidales bacterium]
YVKESFHLSLSPDLNRRPSRHYMSGCSTNFISPMADELSCIVPNIFCFCIFSIYALLNELHEWYQTPLKISSSMEFLI